MRHTGRGGPICCPFRWARPLSSQVWQALGDANSVALQAVMNIRTVRSFGTETKEVHTDAQFIVLRYIRSWSSIVHLFSISFSIFTSSFAAPAVPGCVEDHAEQGASERRSPLNRGVLLCLHRVVCWRYHSGHRRRDGDSRLWNVNSG